MKIRKSKENQRKYGNLSWKIIKIKGGAMNFFIRKLRENQSVFIGKLRENQEKKKVEGGSWFF